MMLKVPHWCPRTTLSLSRVAENHACIWWMNWMCLKNRTTYPRLPLVEPYIAGDIVYLVSKNLSDWAHLTNSILSLCTTSLPWSNTAISFTFESSSIRPGRPTFSDTTQFSLIFLTPQMMWIILLLNLDCSQRRPSTDSHVRSSLLTTTSPLVTFDWTSSVYLHGQYGPRVVSWWRRWFGWIRQ